MRDVKCVAVPILDYTKAGNCGNTALVGTFTGTVWFDRDMCRIKGMQGTMSLLSSKPLAMDWRTLCVDMCVKREVGEDRVYALFYDPKWKEPV